jgi:hypothetical protein
MYRIAELFQAGSAAGVQTLSDVRQYCNLQTLVQSYRILYGYTCQHTMPLYAENTCGHESH